MSTSAGSNAVRARWRNAWCVASLAILGSCAVGPDFHPPAPPATVRYTREALPADTVVADGRAQHFTADAVLTADWWRLFKSAQLDAVVQQAIANNSTLQASEATLRQSQHNLRAGYGVFFPQALRRRMPSASASRLRRTG